VIRANVVAIHDVGRDEGGTGDFVEPRVARADRDLRLELQPIVAVLNAMARVVGVGTRIDEPCHEHLRRHFHTSVVVVPSPTQASVAP
jgi:hypothetical protein